MNLKISNYSATLLLTISSMQLNAEVLDADNYAKSGSTKGVVILAANWARQWNCGEYENAQLVKLEFTNLESKSKLTVDTPSKLTAQPAFINSGFIVEPGTYAISAYSIKVAKSITDIGYFSADSDKLMPDNNPKAGTFTVSPGQVAYIGHYAIDCYKEPIPWRYYPEGKEAFASYSNSIKEYYSFLKDAEVSFNILDTTVFGQPYELE